MQLNTHSSLPFWGLLLAGACAQADPQAPVAALELKPIVHSRLALFQEQVSPSLDAEPLNESWLEELDGLVTMLSSSKGSLRQVALDAVRSDMGPAACPRLGQWLVNEQRTEAERLAAAELLAALDHPDAAELLMVQVEQAHAPWLRSWCAWYVGNMNQDQCVPRLLLRLRYEKDPSTFLWLSRALLHYRNYAGLAALSDLASRGAVEQQRATATELLSDAAQAAGVDVDQLQSLWGSAQATDLPQPEPSVLLRQAVWRLVEELSEEHFQLRGVDDARYVLSRMGPWTALEIAPALGDVDAHVRLHVAQVLERMGPRAVATGPFLLAALDDLRVAPAAAEALGRVGYPPAVPALIQKCSPTSPHELRVAALRALGRTGLSEGLMALQSAFDESGAPADLRQAAATGLVLLDSGEAVVPWLLQQLADPQADGEAAEIALETWLVRSQANGKTGFTDHLNRWRAHGGPPGVIPTLDEVRVRMAARAADLGEALNLKRP